MLRVINWQKSEVPSEEQIKLQVNDRFEKKNKTNF